MLVLRMLRCWSIPAQDAPEPRAAGVLLEAKGAGITVLDLTDASGTPLAIQKVMAETAALDTLSVPVLLDFPDAQSADDGLPHYRRHVLPRGTRCRGQGVTQAARDRRLAALSAASETQTLELADEPWYDALVAEITGYPHAPRREALDALAAGYVALTTPGLEDNRWRVGPPRPILQNYQPAYGGAAEKARARDKIV